MRLGWVALPVLLAMTACSPVGRYQEAARSLRFTLDRVEPDIQLAFPLDRSVLNFQVTLVVENPSTVAFHVYGFEGVFRLDMDGKNHPLGEVRMAQPLDLPAGGRERMAVDLAFGYRDLASRWPAIQAALHGERPGSWELEGTLHGEIYGIPVNLPVRTRRSFGAAP
jgi:hypothetical protein